MNNLGFNFAEVISSVQKHRPSRCYAAYELLNKKFLKGNTPPKKVSLQKVREELEKAKAPSLGASESDSGFENKSSSSETELNKKTVKQPAVVTTLPRRPVQRNNSSTLPAKPLNKPVRWAAYFISLYWAQNNLEAKLVFVGPF